MIEGRPGARLSMDARMVFFTGATAVNARIVGPTAEGVDESTGVNSTSIEAASSSGGGEFADTESVTGRQAPPCPSRD